MTTPATAHNPETLRQIVACCKAMDDKKAEDIRVLYLGEDDSLTTYFVLVTGNSQPHLRALRISLEMALDECGVTDVRSERDTVGGWIVVDAGDFMVHVFTEEMRNTYKIELLKRDSKDITKMVMKEIVAAAPPPPPVASWVVPVGSGATAAKKPRATASRKKKAADGEPKVATPRKTTRKPKAKVDADAAASAEKPKRAPRAKKAPTKE